MRQLGIWTLAAGLVCLSINSFAQAPPEEKKGPNFGEKSVEYWRSALRRGTAETRIMALQAIGGAIGDDVTALFPDTIARLRDTNAKVRAAAFDALAMHNKVPFGPMVAAFREDERDWQLRAAIMELIARMNPPSDELIELLQEGRDDKSWHVRKAAAYGLGRMANHPGDAARGLQATLRDKEWAVRLAALQGLTELGTAGKPFLPFIDSMSTADPIWEVRAGAIVALGKIAGGDPATATKLKNILENPKSVAGVRVAAVRAMGGLGKNVKTVLPILIEKLRSTDPNFQTAAIEAIGDLGSAAKEVIPTLSDMLISPDWKGAEQAAKLLGKLRADSAAARLGQALKMPQWPVRKAAAEALGQIGGSASAAVNDLIGALRDSEWPVRLAAAEALGLMGPKAKAAVNPLIELATSQAEPSATVKDAAKTAVARIDLEAAKKAMLDN